MINWHQPVFSNPTRVLLHGRGWAHAIEQLELLAIFLDDVSAWLGVACQHSTQHDKVCARSKRLGNIPWACAAPILKMATIYFHFLKVYGWRSNERYKYKWKSCVGATECMCVTVSDVLFTSHFILLFMLHVVFCKHISKKSWKTREGVLPALHSATTAMVETMTLINLMS